MMAQQVDRSQPHFIFRGERADDGTHQVYAEARGKTIPVMDITVRVPCGRCNGGWMSQLEGRTKPILEAMMSGDAVVLDETAVRTVATWAFKTAAMLQFNDHRTRAVSKRDLILLKRHLLPGGITNVYAFSMATRSNSMRLCHNGAMLLPPEFTGPKPDHANISSTAICVDRVGLLVVYSDLAIGGEWQVVPPPAVPGLVHLWPSPRPVMWPPRPVDDRIAEAIITYLPNAAGAVNPGLWG